VDDIVARYLRQTRLAQSPGPVHSPLATIYHDAFATIRNGLDLSDVSLELFVTYSLNARVECLSVTGNIVVIYDQYLGQCVNRLNDFALAEWPVEPVLKWGFRRLAISLAALGRFEDSYIALELHRQWPSGQRPVSRSKQLAAARSLVTYAHEFFILAHECAHVALAYGRLTAATREFGDVIEHVIDRYESARATNANHIAEAMDEAMLDDECRAIRLGSINFSVDRDALAKAYRGRPPESAESLRAQITDLPHLREELLCDTIATELTIAHFSKLGADLMWVLPNILHVLHNLSTLEVIREHAREIADTQNPAQSREASARKAVWRTLMLEMHGEAAGGREALHERFVVLTDLNAHMVSDHFIFTLPAEYDLARRQIQASTVDPAILSEFVRDQLLKLVDIEAAEAVSLRDALS
jgi:hypothetical protein